MAKVSNVTQAPLPNIEKDIPSDFNIEDFRREITAHGYRIVHYKAITCPCAANNQGAALSNCQNCGGTGTVYINPTETRAVITGIKQKQQQQEWNQTVSGELSVTPFPGERWAVDDRFVLLDGEEAFTETIRLDFDAGNDGVLGMLSYPPISIEAAFLFSSEDKPLVRLLPETDYTIQETNVLLADRFKRSLEDGELRASFRYIHRPEFVVLEINRAIMVSDERNNYGQRLPRSHSMNLTAIRWHQRHDLSTGYKTANLFDNSFTTQQQCSNL